ncbi:hypothetical protein SAMN04515671_3165 [Nakamurella panacisegetis]|uniref:Uncharacterized protein n=1 Tax=Nakamurella panacisegetis TaxID=1090615 RepID=A0A1H0QP29_9ACTN|nr:hypothetical protein [Nakamurella panacisegetis]SDP18499.1 hypothetical protein SAMN04515671_3165 [Nakamurella panacisegetis]
MPAVHLPRGALLAVVAAFVLGGCSTSTPGSSTPAASTASAVASPSAAASASRPPSTLGSSPVATTGAAEPSSTTSTIATPSPTASSSPTTTAPAYSATTSHSRTSSPASSSAEPTRTGDGVLPTDLKGVVYGYIKAVDVKASRLTLDKVDWFTGAAALKACEEDKVSHEAWVNGWCSKYYIRNVNPTLRVVSVSPHVSVTTLNGNGQVTGDLASLKRRIATVTGSGRTYRLTVHNGMVTTVTEIYSP